MNKKEGVRSFFRLFREKPILILLAAAALALLLFGAISGDGGDAAQESTADAYAASLEKQLASLLGNVEGVGDVSVMVTLECGETKEYSGSKLTASEMPKVAGVAIVCRGGGHDRVRAEIIEIVSALFGIGRHRITVSEKKS